MPNTGQHSVTAIAEHIDPEPNAVLEWAGDTNTALIDLLLLLSLFTKRDVFGAPTEEESAGAVIIRDPRVYAYGGILRLSILYAGQPIDPEPYEFDIGFVQGLNRVYDLIRSEEWRTMYRGGYFLFLANQAFRRQTLEASYAQCWTIWEHLFSVHNGRWLSDSQIRNLSAHEKISFILTEYDVLENIDERARSRVISLARVRNRLVHYGRFPGRSNVYEDAHLFVQLTEWVLATILQLQPSNALNTQERLQEFLNR